MTRNDSHRDRRRSKAFFAAVLMILAGGIPTGVAVVIMGLSGVPFLETLKVIGYFGVYGLLVWVGFVIQKKADKRADRRQA